MIRAAQPMGPAISAGLPGQRRPSPVLSLRDGLGQLRWSGCRALLRACRIVAWFATAECQAASRHRDGADSDRSGTARARRSATPEKASGSPGFSLVSARPGSRACRLSWSGPPLSVRKKMGRLAHRSINPEDKENLGEPPCASLLLPLLPAHPGICR